MGKYFAFYRLAFKHTIRNKKGMFGLSIFLLACLVIFAYLWEVVAARKGALNLNANDLLWYIALNEWVLISMPHLQEDMDFDLKSGRLAYQLPRPISYLKATFFENAGKLSANMLVLGVVTVIFTSLRIGSMPSLSVLLISIPLGMGAGLVGIGFYMFIGLTGFWLKDITPFSWIWEKFLFLFGGLILPLSIYPIWVQKIAYFTPFPIILGERSSIALSFTWSKVAIISAYLVFWAFFVAILVLLAFRKGMKQLQIEGG